MKRKFVKVMFFGALALSTVTYVGCKDYDDDIKSVQEQIDQIKSNNPVSVGDMQSAINAAKSALEDQLATLKTNLENKDSQIETLNQKVADLEKDLANAADKATVDQLTKDLAKAQTDLEALKKLQQSDIDALTIRIKSLEDLTQELDRIKTTFATKAELSDYVKSANLSGLISDEIVASLGDDGKIATAINNAIQTKVLAEFGSMKEVAALAGENGTVAEVIKQLHAAINNDKTGILARLVKLEDYKTALEDKAVESGFENVEAVIAEVESLKETLSGLYASSEFGDKVKEIVEAELETVKDNITTLESDLEKLGIAIKGMIQSVVYIPTTIDHSVDFYTLYAKKTETATTYDVAAKSDGAQVLQFRISPASAAMTKEDFNKNYEIKLNAEERSGWTRAAEPFAVEVEDCEAGVLTVSLTTSSAKSHAISLNIASKKDAEGKEGLTPTNVNSDYIAVIQSSYYLKTAYYDVAEEKDDEIIYNAPQPVDYSKVGTLMVEYAKTEKGNAEKPVLLTTLNVKNIFATTYSLTGSDADLFVASTEGAVSLKTAGLVASLDKTADVMAKVEAPGFYLETSANNPKKLGTVKVTRTIDELKHAYAQVECNWDNSSAAADESVVLNTADIYNDPAVNIRPSAYEALTLIGSLPTTGVRLEKGVNNALTLIIPKNTAAGDYTATAKFEGDGYTLTVTVPVKIKAITLAKLERVPEMWSSDKTHTGFTPTKDSQTAATAITSEFSLTTIFSNFDAVKTAVLAKGGTFEITTNAATIPGVDYDANNAKFTFDKDNYTGKMTDGAPAVVKFTIKVSYNGKEEEKIEGIVEVKDISGTWVAPATTSLSLSDKSVEYNVSTGFAWNDLAGKTMWKDGALVAGTGNNGFATTVNNPLDIYGLVAPTFVFKEAIASTYLVLDRATGKISFTEEGQTHHFYEAVTYTVEVKATSKWGTIKNYAGKNTITVTIPAE